MFFELSSKKCTLRDVNIFNRYKNMKNKILLLTLCLTFNLFGDHHKGSSDKGERKMPNPNHLLSFKECKETKDGIDGLLSAAESIWKEIEMDPENEEKWIEASVLVDLAANYSTVYDVWCKDMINHRMKMRIMGEKKKHKKEMKKEDG